MFLLFLSCWLSGGLLVLKVSVATILFILAFREYFVLSYVKTPQAGRTDGCVCIMSYVKASQVVCFQFLSYLICFDFATCIG